MASTFTAFLKFNKPALGDAGWGTAVNGGFTDLVDQAITGFIEKAVVAGANSLGSIASGASSDARNQFILLTGTLTSSATLTVPAGTASPGNNKLYFIKNTAGDEVTITNGGASTVVVPDGKSMMLRSTSTGVEEAMTHQFSLSLGTALPATSGGTGQSSYAVGDLLYAGTTTTLAKLAAVATGSVLRSKGVGTAPAYEQLVLTTDVTGILPVANGGTGLSAPGALNNVLSSDGAGAWASTALSTLVPDASDTAKGVVELATTAEIQTGTDTTRVITPAGLRGGAIVRGTALPTTSGTVVIFAPPSAGIPSWAKRITVMFGDVSTNGSSPVIIQLGDSGGIETTGYASAASFGGSVGNFSTSTAGFIVDAGNVASAAATRRGFVVLVNLDGNQWVGSGSLDAGGQVSSCISGSKTLSDVLTQVRITTVNGTDTFDAGSVNILYE